MPDRVFILSSGKWGTSYNTKQGNAFENIIVAIVQRRVEQNSTSGRDHLKGIFSNADMTGTKCPNVSTITTISQNCYTNEVVFKCFFACLPDISLEYNSVMRLT